MVKYSVKQVENLTGINAHTLRVWERRYNLITPLRTATNIRYYTDEQLKKLLNISILLKNGYRISRINNLSEIDINNTVTSILKEDSVKNRDQIQALVISMLEFDEVAFNTIYSQSVKKNGVLESFLQLIYPFMVLVGGLWTTNNAIPSQEHFISNLIRQKLIAAIEAIDQPKMNRKKMILFLLEEETHELGLLLANFLAKNAGWIVYYLGQNVPTSDVAVTAKITKTDVLFTMITTSRPNKALKRLNQIQSELNVQILISGNISKFIEMSDNTSFRFLSSPSDFQQFLISDISHSFGL